MKMLKNNLDEMQEQKLLKIEHTGCWFAFWGLLASMIVQMFIYDEMWMRYLAGEWIVFMSLSVYLLAACIKAGIWDRHLKPNLRVNFLCSTVAALVMAAIYFVRSYINYGSLMSSILTAVIMLLFVFAACLGGLSFFSAIYKKRVSALEDKSDSEDGAK